MVVNESFLDSATLRENVVSLARNIGYVPRSKTAATARVSFTVDIPTNTKTATLKPGLVCVGNTNDSSYLFSTTENISAPAVFNGADPNNPAVTIFGYTKYKQQCVSKDK